MYMVRYHTWYFAEPMDSTECGETVNYIDSNVFVEYAKKHIECCKIQSSDLSIYILVLLVLAVYIFVDL